MSSHNGLLFPLGKYLDLHPLFLPSFLRTLPPNTVFQSCMHVNKTLSVLANTTCELRFKVKMSLFHAHMHAEGWCEVPVLQLNHADSYCCLFEKLILSTSFFLVCIMWKLLVSQSVILVAWNLNFKGWRHENQVSRIESRLPTYFWVLLYALLQFFNCKKRKAK